MESKNAEKGKRREAPVQLEAGKIDAAVTAVAAAHWDDFIAVLN